ncbi:enoyl-CoA hydratase-related protein [Pigmentiphaga soli]|uniref:Enoyl-CoA hydratase-related protein n=1 Tax=Pigmentiphaga soli TaxID=1007095 RepID=A0ABP8HN72_9BURK
MNENDRVSFSMRGHVGVVAMQDASRYNALAPAQVRAVLAAVERSRQAGARALLIASGVKHFCAGADIEEMLKGGSLRPETPRQPGMATPITLFRTLVEDPRPVLCLVDGLAMGGGVELVLSCDLCIATPAARFMLPELGLGVLPRTALLRLPELVGRRRALDLILSRRKLSCDEALAMGLVNRQVPQEGALDAALAWANDIVSAPPGALAAVKRNLGRIAPDDWDGLHGLLGQMVPAEWEEGFGAFLEKRTPDYEPFWQAAGKRE